MSFGWHILALPWIKLLCLVAAVGVALMLRYADAHHNWIRCRLAAEVSRSALATWGLWTAIVYAWDRVQGPGHAASVGTLLPHRPLEIVTWIALSITAGFAEELVFRGYLQRQFQAWTGSLGVAVALQAILFGVSHGYQGVRACARITLYGLLFGILAARRGSLRPGMIAHAWTDIASGVFRI